MLMLAGSFRLGGRPFLLHYDLGKSPLTIHPELIEALARLRFTSAPGHPLSLAGFGIMFVCSDFRQSLLRPAAAYTSGNLQNLPVLQVARLSLGGGAFPKMFSEFCWRPQKRDLTLAILA